MTSLRASRGMQVHAVPESERAYDSSGRQLPWGYEYADSDIPLRRPPEEKGPFGKSTRRRGTSRSKTATPARKDDLVQQDNNKIIDDLFTSFKNDLKAQEKTREESPAAPTAAVEGTAAPAAALPAPQAREPTEVILYGYGAEMQYAAIEFFERISNGLIYEEYERHPPHSKYDLTLSASRSRTQKTIPPAALRKKNSYAGGNHWIKVTFDSPEAADLACHYSPHVIHGYSVFAEPYRGTGPVTDAAIPGSQAAGLSSTTSPVSSNSKTLSQPHGSNSPGSSTATSATATASHNQSEMRLRQSTSAQEQPSSSTSATLATSSSATGSQIASAKGAQALGKQQQQQAPLRVRGAKRAVLLPAEQALLPVAPLWQQTLAKWPLVGLIFSGGSDIIGNHVPRKEDGSFDWEGASIYWRYWASIDSWFGTDFCGMKGDD